VREALAEDEQALRERPADLMTGADLVTVSPYIWFVMLRGVLLTAMGHLDDATRACDRAVELARAHDDFEVLAQALSFASTLASLEANGDAAFAHARHALEIAEKTGSAFSRILAHHALGEALLLQGQASAAVDALQRALAILQDRHAGRQDEPGILRVLAEAHLAAGDPRAAREAAEGSLTIARERGMRMAECAAHLALGRVLVRSEGVLAREAVESALAHASSLAEETGATRYAPFIHLEQAELARLLRDDTARQHELSEAARLFAEMGAPVRAGWAAKELAAGAPSRIPSTDRP
jgi:tetratricopeptide (TPR) repeat protein